MASRNVVVCLDGTWNTSDLNRLSSRYWTNVYLLYKSVLPKSADGREQVKLYLPGVGTHRRPLSRLLDGMTGNGVFLTVRLALEFIQGDTNEGDRIFIFGFSRGAFAARHLAGVIAWHGFTTAPHVDVERTFELNGGEIEPGILHFRHALALDERRRNFMPELYALSSLPQYAHDFQQLWFHGYHSDVGGGVPKDRSGLSRSVLTWMSKEAQKQGLGLTAIQMELAASQPLAANSSDIPILTRAYHYDRARHYDNPHTGILKEVWEEREGLGRPGPRRRNKLVQNS
jgi:uncharacterized protein (DUF2235 family)